jgi:hypothetical protein
MANKKFSDFTTLTSKTATMYLVGYDGVSNIKILGSDYENYLYVNKTQDYTILNNNQNIIANPNVAGGTGQYGVLTMTLPAGAAGIIGKSFKVFHGANAGIVKILCQGSDKINTHGTQITFLKLFNAGEQVEVVWNGTYFSVRGSTNIKTWQARSSWDNRHCGNGFTYDGKSAGVDLTGMTLIEATSNNTALCIYDSGGTGTSGILYFTDMTGTMLWTNDRVVTAVNGTTVSVNESTSSKNKDYNFYHGMGLDISNISKQRPLYNTSATIASAFLTLETSYDAVNGAAWMCEYIGIDTNYIKLQTGINGLKYGGDSGGQDGTADGFIFQKIDFNF